MHTDLIAAPARLTERPDTAIGSGCAATWSLDILAVPGTPFLNEGSASHGAYIVVQGAVLLSRLTQDGKRHILSILGPGDVFGLTSGAVYDCTVEPSVETIVRRLESAFLEGSGALQKYVMKQLQLQLEASREHAVRLQRRSAEVKLASFLLSLPPSNHGRAQCDDRGADSERIMLPLVDIADYLSLRMETVCRVLSRFRQRGLIAVRARGQLTILNSNELLAISSPTD